MTPAKANPWFAAAKGANSIVPISRFVGSHMFALKSGGYGCLFSLAGVDEESLADAQLAGMIATVEGGLKGMPENSTLNQYMRVRYGGDLPRREQYEDAITESFISTRLAFLNQTANFRKIDLHWCLTVEPPRKNTFKGKPSEKNRETARLLLTLQKTASILEEHLRDALGLRLLDKQEVFSFFSEVFNLEPWSGDLNLVSDTDVDRQIARSTIQWNPEHIRVGRRYVQAFNVMQPPAASRPCIFSAVMSLRCDVMLHSTWRPKTSAEARKEVSSQEQWVDFFKVGVVARLYAGKDYASLDTGAGAKAAGSKVDKLGDVVTELDEKTFGEYTLRVLLSASTKDQLEHAGPMVHRMFVDSQAALMEETRGTLSAFYALFPGNKQYSVFKLWLSDDHHARMSLLFAPHIGHSYSEDLEHEYLNVLETRQGTPYFHDAYVNGVRVGLVIGPTGSGKSVHVNQAIAMERKYNGFTFIFDIGNSYESMVELYGGRVDKVGLDGPRVNPFALPKTDKNLKFLYTFVKLLLTSSGAALSPEDDDTIFKAVEGMYHLELPIRRLGSLVLPLNLDRYLAKWKDSGVYANIFDNGEDSLTLSRIQCWDFAGITKAYPDLVEPLMVWLLRRIDDVVYDPANLGVPKHVVIEEVFTNMRNPKLLEGALDSIKQVRKNLGGVTLVGQSATDLGAHASMIVNSCSSFLFLPDPSFDREFYSTLFKLSDNQVRLFESLRPREALYIRKGQEDLNGTTKVVRLNLDARSYAIFSTKPKDRRRRAALIERYGLSDGIDRFAKGESA